MRPQYPQRASPVSSARRRLAGGAFLPMRVLVEQGEVLLVLRPAQLALVMVADEHAPILAGLTLDDTGAVTSAAEGVGACMIGLRRICMMRTDPRPSPRAPARPARPCPCGSPPAASPSPRAPRRTARSCRSLQPEAFSARSDAHRDTGDLQLDPGGRIAPSRRPGPKQRRSGRLRRRPCDDRGHESHR